MKKSILLLINNILGMVYMGGFFYAFNKVANSTDADIRALTTGVTLIIMFPHIILIFLAILFGWIGFAFNKTGFALTSAILYCVGAIFFYPVFYYQIPMIVIGFIAYGKMLNRIKKYNTQVIQAS